MNPDGHGKFSLQLAGSIFSIALLMMLLTACDGGSSHFTGKSTMKDAKSAALTPLRDLGITKDEIPIMLAELTARPYGLPKPLNCTGLQNEMTELDTLLGPDVDAPKVTLTANEEYAQTGSNLLHDGIVGLIKSQADIIPFSGLVRRLTGAASHEKAIANAYQAGKLRRAYLKGVASARFGDKCSFEPILITENKKDDKTPGPDAPDLEVAKK